MRAVGCLFLYYIRIRGHLVKITDTSALQMKASLATSKVYLTPKTMNPEALLLYFCPKQEFYMMPPSKWKTALTNKTLPTTPSTKKQTQFFDRLFLEGTVVESELLTLEDVSVDTSALAGARRDAGQQTTGSELGLKGGVDLGVHLTGGELALNRLGLGGRLSSGGGLLGLRTTLLSEGDTVVGLVPLTEGSGIDLDDGGLGQGVGT
jgi:hypothetical protein